MTRARKIGYSHAALTTVWFSAMALDRFQVVNGVLGDAGCTAISCFFGFPISWLGAVFIGFPLFPSMPEHFLRMSIVGAVVIVNGLVVGYCVDRFLSWSGSPDRSLQQKGITKQNKPCEATGDNAPS
jgi:phosphatidylserine synthase